MDYSVIIPVYNAHLHLEAALDSVTAQTLPPAEVVLVDDGSTDPETIAVLERIERERDAIVLRQANGGLPKARNAGIRRASAPWILPLDADDVIEPRYAELAADAVAKHGECVVYGRAELFGTIERDWTLPEFSAGRLLYENMIYATAFFPRAAWQRIGGYDEQLRSGREDHDFWIRMVLGEELPVVRLDEMVFRYRQHEVSMNRDLGRDREKLLDTYTRIFRKNADIYAKYSELVIAEQFRRIDKLNEHKNRFGRIERLIDGPGLIGSAYGLLRAARRRGIRSA